MLDATQTQLRIDHYSHERFHEQFRDDLQRAGERVIIFSPFLAQNRTNTYHDLLAGLAARGVAVDVYAKPKHEQPDSLQRQFDVVSHRLALAAVSLHLRPLMHEKIAIVDDAILWHGSLNILSHYDTSESMLRFESAALVDYILADLGLAAAGAGVEMPSNHDEQLTSRAPVCPLCASPMHRYESASLWVCANGPTCAGTLSIQGDEDQPPGVERLALSCPLCRQPLQLHRGWLARLECSNPTCAFSVDQRVAQGILRVLRRRNAV